MIALRRRSYSVTGQTTRRGISKPPCVWPKYFTQKTRHGWIQPRVHPNILARPQPNRPQPKPIRRYRDPRPKKQEAGPLARPGFLLTGLGDAETYSTLSSVPGTVPSTPWSSPAWTSTDSASDSSAAGRSSNG